MEVQEMLSVRPQFTDIEYAALIALEDNVHFKIIKDFIAKRALSLAVLSIEREGTKGEWVRGRAQEMKDINNSIKKAREHYEAIRRKGGK